MTCFHNHLLLMIITFTIIFFMMTIFYRHFYPKYENMIYEQKKSTKVLRRFVVLYFAR